MTRVVTCRLVEHPSKTTSYIFRNKIQYEINFKTTHVVDCFYSGFNNKHNNLFMYLDYSR